MKQLSDGGTVNLLSKSYNIYNINELGLQKCSSSSSSSSAFSPDDGEKTYRCASHEMRVFGSIGSGASSVVQRAIHIPNHRIIALKKINIFEKVHCICAQFSYCALGLEFSSMGLFTNCFVVSMSRATVSLLLFCR